MIQFGCDSLTVEFADPSSIVGSAQDGADPYAAIADGIDLRHIVVTMAHSTVLEMNDSGSMTPLTPDHHMTDTQHQDEYPTLSELVEGPVDILRDGQTIATVDSPNAAFVWLSKSSFGCSVSWMLKHEGYSCRAHVIAQLRS